MAQPNQLFKRQFRRRYGGFLQVHFFGLLCRRRCKWQHSWFYSWVERTQPKRGPKTGFKWDMQYLQQDHWVYPALCCQSYLNVTKGLISTLNVNPNVWPFSIISILPWNWWTILECLIMLQTLNNTTRSPTTIDTIIRGI